MPGIKENSYASVEICLHGYRELNGKREPYSVPIAFTTVNGTTQTVRKSMDTNADFVCEKITHSCIGGGTAAVKYGAGLKVRMKDTDNNDFFQQEVDLLNVSAPAPMGSGLPVLLPQSKRLVGGGQIEVAIRLA